MGEHCEQFIDLTTSLSAAEDRVEEARRWLLREGWSSPMPTEDELFRTAASVMGGPRLYELAPGLQWASVGVVGASTLSDVCWYLGDSTGPADCPRCATRADDDPFWEAVSVWSEQMTEPVLSCSGCGFTAPLGDWDLSGAVAVGSVAVVVALSGRSDYDHAIDVLLSDLRAGLGGRWAYVHYHL